MGRFIDLTGRKFGKLEVMSIFDRQNKTIRWLCKCDCGKSVIVYGSHLKDGHTQSCGCYQIKRVKESKNNAGESHTRIYRIYKGIKSRIGNENAKGFENYGGRGITMCSEWLNDFQAFKFWALSNGYADGLTIDRINVNGKYEPTNCRWVSRFVQNSNRRTTRIIAYNGDQKPMSHWADYFGISRWRFRKRINQGLTIDEILAKEQKVKEVA